MSLEEIKSVREIFGEFGRDLGEFRKVWESFRRVWESLGEFGRVT